MGVDQIELCSCLRHDSRAMAEHDRLTPWLALSVAVVGVGWNVMHIPPNKSGAAGSAFGSLLVLLAWLVTKVVRRVRGR